MKRGLKILLFADSFVILAAAFFGPIYAIFVQEIGGDILDASGAWAAFMLATGILIFFISRWEDHVKHQEKLLVFSYGLMCVGFIGYLLVQSPWHLFVVQIVLGIAEAFNTPVYDGLYSKFLDRGKYASEWGLWDSMSAILAGIGAIIGGFIAAYFGFRILFVAMFVFSLIGFFISIRLMKTKNIQIKRKTSRKIMKKGKPRKLVKMRR